MDELPQKKKNKHRKRVGPRTGKRLEYHLAGQKRRKLARREAYLRAHGLLVTEVQPLPPPAAELPVVTPATSTSPEKTPPPPLPDVLLPPPAAVLAVVTPATTASPEMTSPPPAIDVLPVMTPAIFTSPEKTPSLPAIEVPQALTPANTISPEKAFLNDFWSPKKMSSAPSSTSPMIDVVTPLRRAVCTLAISTSPEIDVVSVFSITPMASPWPSPQVEHIPVFDILAKVTSPMPEPFQPLSITPEVKKKSKRVLKAERAKRRERKQLREKRKEERRKRKEERRRKREAKQLKKAAKEAKKKKENEDPFLLDGIPLRKPTRPKMFVPKASSAAPAAQLSGKPVRRVDECSLDIVKIGTIETRTPLIGFCSPRPQKVRRKLPF